MRNVFLRVGRGRFHLYQQPPKTIGQVTVHHLGVQTDELNSVVRRLRDRGVSVTDIQQHPDASYAMAEGPDQLLIEIFQPGLDLVPDEMRDHFGTPDSGFASSGVPT